MNSFNFSSVPEADDYAAQAALLFDDWVAPDQQQESLRLEYAAFVREGVGGAVRREGGSQHVTASAFVLSHDLTQILLCFHKKGQFWVQVGGHTESGDSDLAASALREATEESGIAGLQLVTPFPSDLNRHDLASAFGQCRTHWDVGFVFLAPANAQPIVSEESEAVRWWPVNQLPQETPENLPSRVAYALHAVGDRIA